MFQIQTWVSEFAHIRKLPDICLLLLELQIFFETIVASSEKIMYEQLRSLSVFSKKIFEKTQLFWT